MGKYAFRISSTFLVALIGKLRCVIFFQFFLANEIKIIFIKFVTSAKLLDSWPKVCVARSDYYVL